MAPLKPGLCPLLTEEVVEKLKSVGIKSVVDFISESATSLSKRAGLPSEDLQSIRQSLLLQFGCYPVSAKELWEEQCLKLCAVFSTGCTSLDALLGGGVVAGHVTEVCGPPASGKTQLCLAVTGSVVMTTGYTAVYIDSRCGFSSTRLVQMLENKGLKEKDLARQLKRVKVVNVTDIFELLDVLETLRKNIAEQVDGFHSNLRLVILDSITYFISPLLGGRQCHGHALMTRVSMAIKSMASDHSLSVLYSNNVVVDFNSGGGAGGGVKPALGRTWTYVPSTRVMLSQQQRPTDVRTATITKSSRQPTGSRAEFLITERGLENVDDQQRQC